MLTLRCFQWENREKSTEHVTLRSRHMVAVCVTTMLMTWGNSVTYHSSMELALDGFPHRHRYH